ncbi:MAG: hypothetical protein M3436_19400 [Pseudomonadota bacterium]|nr:hypothetical protein [Pseudomonadota bacterium]
MATSNQVTIGSLPPQPVYTLAASPSTVATGGQLTAIWTASGGRSTTDWVGLYRVGDPDETFVAWKYTGGTASGSRNFTAPAQAGQYDFRYFLADGYTRAASSGQVTVGTTPPPPPPVYTLAASPSTVASGDQLTASWTASGGRSTTDWVGLFRVGDPDASFVGRQYTGGTASGSRSFTAPAQAGQYDFRYFLADGYTRVASSGQVAVGTTPPPAITAGAEINYTLTADSVVTLNITRPDGWIVRELIVGESKKLGANKAFWDGRDNDGRLLPEGPYQWRLLTHKGVTTSYITSIGNSGTPPWFTADGTGAWGGNLGNPAAVTSDSTGVYIAWTAAEGNYSVQKRTFDGSKAIWGSNIDAFFGYLAIASDDAFLYAGKKEKLSKIDRNTGREILWVPLDTERPAGDTSLIGPAGSLTFNFSRDDQYGNGFVWGMAAGGGRVYVSNPLKNRIEVFEAGSLGRVDTIAMPRPRGLALDGLGNLLVVTNGKVLSVKLQTKVATPIISTGLEAPFALARAQGGALFVTDLGQSQQVKKFSAAGQLLATFGRKGGGLDALTGGQFQPQDFRHASSITVLADGTFWVGEDSMPKRTGRFSATGTLLYQGFGSVNISALTAPNPNDMNEVFSTMWGTFTSRVDYTNKTSAMGRILRPRWGSAGAGVMSGVGENYTPEKMLSFNGKTYMWAGMGVGGGQTLYLVEADHLRPVMACIANLPEEGSLTNLARARGIERQGWATEVSMWCDDNGDAAVQSAEVRIVHVPNAENGPQFFKTAQIANDFTLFTSFGYSWKPRGFAAGGAPLYHQDDILTLADFPSSWIQFFEGESPERDGLGNFYNLANPLSRSLPVGEGFWAGRSSECYLRSYDKNWNQRWVIGQKAQRAAAPGEMYFVQRNCGEMANCLFVTDMEGMVHVIHRDGFYVTSLMQDPYKPQTMGPDRLDVEAYSGSVMENPVTKRKFLYISGSQASHVFEVNGLPSIVVNAPRAFTLTKPSTALPAPADYLIKRVVNARVVDGIVPNYGIEWSRDVSMIPILRDGKLKGEVGLLYDDSYLYVRADMLSNGFSNMTEEGNIPYAFEGGDTLELLIGMNPAANVARTAAVKGDQRIVYANTAELNAGALLMQPVSTVTNPAPFSYQGASATTTLQNVQFWQVDAGQVNVGVDYPVHGNGAVVQIAIPLSSLLLPGQTLATIKGKRLRFDIGMVWKEGAKRIKSYWQGKNPNMLVTTDRAVETKLYPDGWGNAIFDDGQNPVGSDLVEAVRATPDWLVDGGDAEWTAQAETKVEGSSGHVARFRTAWDAQNFYASILVIDSSPLINGSGKPELIIKGGDAVGFCFGTPGLNQKIVFADVGGAHVNMAYRPVWPIKKPYTFSSPVSSVTLEYVGAINPQSMPQRLSDSEYWLEVAIPWTQLGITPQAGMQIPFDVQVIFGDPAGDTNIYTAWWHSRSAETAATFDLPTEAKLYPSLWGKVLLK